MSFRIVVGAVRVVELPDDFAIAGDLQGSSTV